MYAATMAVTIRTATITANVAGSNGLTLNNWLASSRFSANEPATPMATPASASAAPWRRRLSPA